MSAGQEIIKEEQEELKFKISEMDRPLKKTELKRKILFCLC